MWWRSEKHVCVYCTYGSTLTPYLTCTLTSVRHQSCGCARCQTTTHQTSQCRAQGQSEGHTEPHTCCCCWRWRLLNLAKPAASGTWWTVTLCPWRQRWCRLCPSAADTHCHSHHHCQAWVSSRTHQVPGALCGCCGGNMRQVSSAVAEHMISGMQQIAGRVAGLRHRALSICAP